MFFFEISVKNYVAWWVQTFGTPDFEIQVRSVLASGSWYSTDRFQFRLVPVQGFPYMFFLLFAYIFYFFVPHLFFPLLGSQLLFASWFLFFCPLGLPARDSRPQSCLRGFPCLPVLLVSHYFFLLASQLFFILDYHYSFLLVSQLFVSSITHFFFPLPPGTKLNYWSFSDFSPDLFPNVFLIFFSFFLEFSFLFSPVFFSQQ